MAAYEIPNLRFSMVAGANIARRRFIKPDSNGNGIQAVAGDAIIAVSMNDPKSGEVLELADGIVMVEAGAAIAAGAAVQSDANGKAITLAAGTKAGVALTAATAASQLVTIKI